MKNLENQIFNRFKIKNVFPFYIRNVNSLFFENLNSGINNQNLNVQNQSTHPNEHHEHNFLDKEVITGVINVILSRIISITGTQTSELFKQQGFDAYNNKMYIKQSDNEAYRKVLGNKEEENFFSYTIEFNESNYLYELIDGIDFSFHLNKETQHITGGFSWNNFKFNLDKNYIVNNFYFINLVNTFLETELFPLHLKKILNIFKKDEEGVVLFDQLKQKWADLVDATYEIDQNIPEINYIQERKNQIFEKLLILLFLMIHLLEQIDDYFTNKNVHEFLHLNLKENDFGNNADQSEGQDLVALVNYLNEQTDINEVEVEKNKVFFKYDNYTISEPIEFYEIKLNKEAIFLDTNALIANKLLSSVLAILLFSKSFGLGSSNLFQMNYSMLLDLVNENINIDELNFINDQKEKEILDSICEINFDYISLLKNNKVVILENNSDYAAEVVNQVSYYYFWSEIYLQSKIIELKDIENYVNYFFRSNEKWKLITFRKIIRDLHDLDFNDNDHFYGAHQIKHIVKHIDTKNDYHSLLHKLTFKVKNEDEIYKRQTERMSIIIAFMVALMIGYIDFFACVYSVAPCSYGNITWPWILSSVTTGTVFAFVNLIILLTTLTYLILTRKKIKDIENRKDKNMYFGYNNSPLAKAANNNRPPQLTLFKNKPKAKRK